MLRLMRTGVVSWVLVVALVAGSPASLSAAFVTVPAVTFVPRGASAAGDVTHPGEPEREEATPKA